MTINQISENIYESVIDGSLNNADLVQIIELCGSYLNLKTISQYAADEGKSYNGSTFALTIESFFRWSRWLKIY